MQRIIRLATFVAKVVVVLLVANTGVDNDEQAPEVTPCVASCTEARNGTRY